MQARAIIEAALELKSEGVKTFPEIMIPLIGTVEEFKLQEKIVRGVAKEVRSEERRVGKEGRSKWRKIE